MAEKHKRSIFIVDPKFQLRFSLLICFLIFLSSSLYPLTIYEILSTFSEKFPQTSKSIEQIKSSIKYFLILWQLGFCLFTFVICVFFTHKIAGPLYKLKKYLQDIRNGYYEGKLYFRDGDYFKEVADEVNDTIEIFQEQFRDDAVYLSEATSFLKNLRQSVPDDKKLVINEIVNRLDEVKERYDELIS